MNNVQMGRLVARALHRSSAYRMYLEAVAMENAMCSSYGVPYSLDDARIIGTALLVVCERLSGWLHCSIECLMDAYDDYSHSFDVSFLYAGSF